MTICMNALILMQLLYLYLFTHISSCIHDIFEKNKFTLHHQSNSSDLYMLILYFLLASGLRYLTQYPLHPFSPGLPIGRNLRWQLLLHQQSSCQLVGEHLVPGGEGHAVENARHACGPSVESATFVKT